MFLLWLVGKKNVKEAQDEGERTALGLGRVSGPWRLLKHSLLYSPTAIFVVHSDRFPAYNTVVREQKQNTSPRECRLPSLDIIPQRERGTLDSSRK